jgi:large subunit ribosomal protein L6
MSRIGKKPIENPAGVDGQIDGTLITVKGPQGTLSRNVHPNMIVEKDGNTITVSRPNDDKMNRSLHGLTRTLINNMVVGTNEGYKKELEVNGVGYRCEVKGNVLTLKIGYSHDVVMTAPEGVTVEVPNPNKIVISGPDKQKVGQFAANVREKRPPEPYKGKGIKYADEHIRRKEGKAGKGGK